MKNRKEYKGISCIWKDDDLNFWQIYEFNTWREALDFIKSNRQNLKKWYVARQSLIIFKYALLHKGGIYEALYKY